MRENDTHLKASLFAAIGRQGKFSSISRDLAEAL
jgi:hypothetical protein